VQEVLASRESDPQPDMRQMWARQGAALTFNTVLTFGIVFFVACICFGIAGIIMLLR
jgi:hypothetical protein